MRNKSGTAGPPLYLPEHKNPNKTTKNGKLCIANTWCKLKTIIAY